MNASVSWNTNEVCDWIINDENLYALAQSHLRRYKDKNRASRHLLNTLHSLGMTHSPHSNAMVTFSALRYTLNNL
jgi:hypothetical protein